MLVVMTFVSLPVCQVNDSFHHVELIQSRLSPFGRAVSHVIFDLLSLAFCVLLLWQLVRFEISSFRFGDQRSDLSGDTAVDPANSYGDRRGGLVLFHGANARGRRCRRASGRQNDRGRS